MLKPNTIVNDKLVEPTKIQPARPPGADAREKFPIGMITNKVTRKCAPRSQHQDACKRTRRIFVPKINADRTTRVIYHCQVMCQQAVISRLDLGNDDVDNGW